MKKTITLIVTALLLLVPVVAVLAQDNNIYISNSGNNNNACTRQAPCLTFTHAHTKAQAGDTIVFLPGTYGAFAVTKSDLVIRAEGEVIIDSTSQNGIRVRDQAERVTIDGFVVQRTYSHAILVTGKDIIVQNNTVRWSVFENASGSGSDLRCREGGWGSGIKVQVGGQNVTIRKNQVYEICGEGIAITRGIGGQIEHNVVRDAFSVNIYVDNSINVIARQNFSSCTRDTRFYRGGNPARGITIGNEIYNDSRNWGNQMANVSMTNNYVDGCRGLRFYNYFSGSVPNVSVTNNYYQNSWDAIISVPSYIHTSNNVIATPPPEWWLWDSTTPIPPTSTRTPTATRTPTNVPTITPSRTPTATATPTFTSIAPSITPTSTFVPSPTFTPVSTPAICPNPELVFLGNGISVWICK